MEKIKTILAALDFSEYSDTVIHHAIEMAERYDGKLVIVNVINKRNINMMVEAKSKLAILDDHYKTTSDDFFRQMKDERTGLIREMLPKNESHPPRTKIVIKVGNAPYQQLIEAVREEAADVVIMGTKGRGNLADVLFGSTAEKMFEHCPVSLFSIRLPDPKKKD